MLSLITRAYHVTCELRRSSHAFALCSLNQIGRGAHFKGGSSTMQDFLVEQSMYNTNSPIIYLFRPTNDNRNCNCSSLLCFLFLAPRLISTPFSPALYSILVKTSLIPPPVDVANPMIMSPGVVQKKAKNPQFHIDGIFLGRA